MLRYKLQFLCGTLLAIASLAKASEQELEALTCSYAERHVQTLQGLQSQSRKLKDGTLALDGRFTDGTLCIEHIYIIGSFGVLMMTGEICKENIELLNRFVLSKTPDFKPIKITKKDSDRGYIFGYTSAKRNIMFFKGHSYPMFGDPDPKEHSYPMLGNPDPNSSQVSYVCLHQVGDAR